MRDKPLRRLNRFRSAFWGNFGAGADLIIGDGLEIVGVGQENAQIG